MSDTSPGCSSESVSPPVSREIVRGIQRGIPIVLGYLPLGFAYGVLAIQNGIPPVPAVLMSLFVFAGSGQFIAAGLWGMGASVFSIVFTTFVVNLRHLLMAASLAPWLRSFTARQQAFFGFELTDETFALHSSAMRTGERASLPLLYAANITAHCGWIGGAVLGVLAGDLLPDPKLFGLDYALPAMFLALLLPQCLRRLHLFAAILSGGLSVGLALAGSGRWNIIIATLATATIGALLLTYRDQHLIASKRRPLHE